MHVECPTCKMLVDIEKYQRCPRCHTFLLQPLSCTGCNGCSLKGLCPSKAQVKGKQ